jgi:hypothetical protein
MPKFLEDKLKAEYGADSKIPYKVMNKIGAMHGNKETAKGAEMEAKHERDVKVNAHTRKAPEPKPKTDSHPHMKYNHSDHPSNHPNMRMK